MLIQNCISDEDKMNSPLKYERDALIQIGNQANSVFTVPEAFLELAREPGSTSPTRPIGQPLGPSKGVLSPFTRQNSRGGGGSLGSIYNGYNNNTSNGAGFVFGRLHVPPPPPSRPDPKKVIVTSKEILLQSNPNAWKPTRVKQRIPGPAAKDDEPKSEEEIMIEGIVKDTRGILNKLTPENFDRLMEKFMVLQLENKEGRIGAVINVLFEKAIDEPAFSAAYAKMVQKVCSSSAETSKLFRKQILDKCQREFQKSNTEEDKIKEMENHMNECAEEDKKAQLKAELEHVKTSMRRRSLGNVRFIGELYKLQMLSPKIMVECVRMLLASPDDENLECLCKLMSTVGQKLDEHLKELEVKNKANPPPAGHPRFPDDKQMDKFFTDLQKLSENKKISSRIRFGIMDLVELRQTEWKPRRANAGPKTIEEIHRDAYIQELEDKKAINSLPPLSPDGNGPRGQGQGHHQQIHYNPNNFSGKKSEWTTVSSNRFQVKKPENKPGGQSFLSGSVIN